MSSCICCIIEKGLIIQLIYHVSTRFQLDSSLIFSASRLDYLFSENVLFSYRSISRKDLIEYISTHYKGPRMVLAAAGGQLKSLYL